ncbi:MAG: type III-A CRISPR-associated protein Csm2 [Thermodesulfobacteriota bacterium]
MPEIKITEVINKIRELKTFSVIDPEFFAKENGAAHIVAKDVRKKMKVTQLRKFFGHIKKIQTKYKGKTTDKVDKSDLFLLMPELAYALGRELISKDFYELMKISLSPEKISTVKDFNCFVNFLSAVLAYHKMEKEG